MSKPQIIEPMRDFCERKHGKEVADKLFGPKQSPSNSTMDKDEFIAMKMLTRRCAYSFRRARLTYTLGTIFSGGFELRGFLFCFFSSTGA